MERVQTTGREAGAHRQVKVKVNAQVDEHIAPVIEALNHFENVVTVDSCQGKDDSKAYVYFTHSGSSGELLTFVDKFAASLNGYLNTREDEYRLRVEWMAGSGTPLAELLMEQESISRLAHAIVAIATYHKSQSVGDN